MNAIERPPVITPELIARQIRQWGITDIELTQELADYTKNTITLTSSRIGDVVIQFGLATRDDIERYASEKPSNVLLLDYLCEKIDNLRPLTQKLLACNDKLAYYDSLSNAPVHPELKTNKTLLDFCIENNCLPLLSAEASSLRLIFSNYISQKSYSQRSAIERKTDIIESLLTAENLTTIIYGVAQREQITAYLTNDFSDNLDTTEDEDKINFWSESAADTPNQKLLARILSTAAEKKASNIKFSPKHNGTVDIFYRRHGKLRRIPTIRTISALQADEMNRFLHTKSLARHTDTAKRVEGRLMSPADGQFVYKTTTSETFLRCSYIPIASEGFTHSMESISLRLLPRDTISVNLKDINVSTNLIQTFHDFLMQSHGMILVVGPTSSGKSTTIAGAISLYQEIYGETKNIVSLEQPVERHLNGMNQFNVHQNKFESGMAALLRHDPDFIWVGELRDRPSASTATRAANTGHMVLSTLHADDTPSAFNALLSYINNNTGSGPDSVIVSQYDVISALSLIVAQRLIPTLCPDCKLSIKHDNNEQFIQRVKRYNQYCDLNNYPLEKLDTTFIHNPDGCKTCEHEGYSGEVPINEILPISQNLRRKLIQMANRGENDLNILSAERKNTLFGEAMLLVKAGRVSIFDAII